MGQAEIALISCSTHHSHTPSILVMLTSTPILKTNLDFFLHISKYPFKEDKTVGHNCA